jgi:hypothetical protein
VEGSNLLDGYGRAVHVGDTVILPGQGPTLWRVSEIGTDLLTRGPQGGVVLRVTLVAVSRFPAAADTKLSELIKVRDSVESPEAHEAMQQAQQAAAGEAQ